MTLSQTKAKSIITQFTDRAKSAIPLMATSAHDARNNALKSVADHVRKNRSQILDANAKDVSDARTQNLKDAFIGRLTLNDERVEAIAQGLEDVARLNDPIGRVLGAWERPNGLKISRVATPLGVLGVIYEARPNVTIDAAALAVKAGNAVVLRGGSSSIHTSTLLAGLMRQGLEDARLPQDAVQIIQDTDRQLVGAMLQDTHGFDVIIPRGGKSLVERVQNDARVPVFAHLEGICHLYLDKDADHQKARQISVNSKLRRVEVCGATETLLVHRALVSTLLPEIITDLITEGCEVRGCPVTMTSHPDVIPATEEDWDTEYLDRIVSVKVVDDLQDAIAHIQKHASDHTDSIITEDPQAAETFLNRIDSAIVMLNASTQFADGGEFGMGAEIGISTGRMHARGPVGAEQLTSFKYIVRGTGQTRP